MTSSVNLIKRTLYLFILVVVLSVRRQSRSLDEESGARRYRPNLLYPQVLLAVLGIELFTLLLSTGKYLSLQSYGARILQVFVHITLFYVIYLPLSLLLKKKLTAQSVAALWMLPTVLRLQIRRLGDSMTEAPPIFRIRLSGPFMRCFLWVWSIGAAAVLLFFIGQHIAFKRKLSRRAVPVQDPELISLWEKLTSEAYLEYYTGSLYITPDTQTPVAVGLFRKKMKIFLPDRTFTPEESELILKHEVIHIAHSDTAAKLFMALCTAFCWFNPIMWISMRRLAEALEMNCDEMLLDGETDPEKRRLYAELILNAAGDARGFSTCLSVRASSLRERMRAVVKPEKKREGLAVVLALMAVVIFTFGMVTFSFHPEKGEISFFAEAYAESEYSFRGASLNPDGRENVPLPKLECKDKDALTAYLCEMDTEEITGIHYFPETPYYAFTFERGYREEFERRTIYLAGDYAYVVYLTAHGQKPGHQYYLPEGTDTAFLESILK